jgi:ankyrin repeat protein
MWCASQYACAPQLQQQGCSIMKHTLSTLTLFTLMCSYTSESNGMLRGGLQLARHTARAAAKIPAAQLPNPALTRTFCNNPILQKVHPIVVDSAVTHTRRMATHTTNNSKALKKQKRQDVKALITAAEEGKVDEAQRLIANGVDINSRNKNGFTALWLATRYEHTHMVKFLLDHGAIAADIDIELATNSHTKEILKLLIEHGARVNTIDRLGLSSIRNAAAGGDPEIVKLLIDGGANVNLTTHGCLAYSQGRQSALMVAALYGYEKIVKLLINHNANVNYTQTYINDCISSEQDYVYTALTSAIYGGHHKIIQLLIDSGADVNQKNKNRYTPLTLATDADNINEIAFNPPRPSLKSCYKMMQLLLNNNADANLLDGYGNTPLVLAISKRKNRKAVELLIGHGANVDLPDGHGVTPLSQAIARKRSEVIQLLIDRGASIEKAVQLLIDHGARIEFQRRDGRLYLYFRNYGIIGDRH